MTPSRSSASTTSALDSGNTMHDYGVAVRSRRGAATCQARHDGRHPVLGDARDPSPPRGGPARGRVPRGLRCRVRAPQASGRVYRWARQLREAGAGLEADAHARRRASRRRDLRRPAADAQRRDPGEGQQARPGRVRRPPRRARGEVRDRRCRRAWPSSRGAASTSTCVRPRDVSRGSSRSPTAGSPGRATAC